MGGIKGIRSIKSIKGSRSKRGKRLTATGVLKHFLLFAFLLFALGLSWKVYSAWKNRVWDTPTRFTVVVAEENPTLYSYDPSFSELTIISVPANTQLDAAWGYGSWLAGSLWSLGVQEKRWDLLSLSLAKNLGVPIDGFVGPGGEKFFQNSIWPLKIFKALMGDVATSLTFFDRIKLLFGPANTPKANRRVISLEEQGVITKTVLADGQKGFVVLPERSRIFFEGLRDERILDEGKTLIVTNSTDKKGLASDVVKITSTLGLRAIGAQTKINEKIEDCLIKTRPRDKNSLSVKRLVKVFNCNVEVEEFEGPADIEILLGEGFTKRF